MKQSDLEGRRTSASVSTPDFSSATCPTERKSLASLGAAALSWKKAGDAGPLANWLHKELTLEGVPRTLEVEDWREALKLLANAEQERPDGWPHEFDAVLDGWFLAMLRFSRPSGSPLFTGRDEEQSTRNLFRYFAERSADPGYETVVDWWFPRRGKQSRHAPPPIPAASETSRVLAILRANWSREGDLCAVDHRAKGLASKFELQGLGKTWLGPTWTSGAVEKKPGEAQPQLWLSNSSSDLAEWSFKVGRATVTRTATLFRGRNFALLSELWNGEGDPGESRFAVPEGVEVAPISDCRGLILRSPLHKSSARVYPIGLPRGSYATDRGSLVSEGNELVLRQPVGRKRSFRILLISWEPLRNRQTVDWRLLTVTESSVRQDPDSAFAARMRWGRDDSLLIYRNLDKPATRAFLGHQTRDRFLVGLFSNEGNVQPIARIEDAPS